MIIEKCVHQVFNGKPTYVEGKLLNNCAICSYDSENNKKCPRYTPMKINVVNLD